MKQSRLILGKKYRFHPFEAVVLLLLAVYSAAVLGLLLWGFLASFRTDRAVATAPWNLFSGLTFDNYMEVFENFKTFKYVDGGTKTVYFEEMFLNSLLYAAGGSLMQTLCTAIVAYCTAKYDNVCSKIVHYTVIVTLSLPIVGNLASMLQVTKALRLFDSIVGSWIMKFGFNNIYYLIFYAFFRKVSWEYAESAFLDGGGHYSDRQAKMDAIRTTDLEAMHLTVIRICNLDIDRNFEGVCEYIDLAVRGKATGNGSLDPRQWDD